MSRQEKKAAAIAAKKSAGVRSKAAAAKADRHSDSDDQNLSEKKSVRLAGTTSVGEAASPATSSAQPKAPKELSRRERCETLRSMCSF